MNYSESLYDNRQLQAYTKQYLDVLPKNVSVLLSSGSSGCAIASAMLATTDRENLVHAYVKKKSEERHQNQNVNTNSLSNLPYKTGTIYKVAIVDDLTQDCDTMRHIINTWFNSLHREAEPRIVSYGCRRFKITTIIVGCCLKTQEARKLAREFKLNIYVLDRNYIIKPNKVVDFKHLV